MIVKKRADRLFRKSNKAISNKAVSNKAVQVILTHFCVLGGGGIGYLPRHMVHSECPDVSLYIIKHSGLTVKNLLFIKITIE